MLYSNRAENIIDFNTLQFASIELANRELEHLLQVNQRIYLKVDVDFFVSVLAVEQDDATVDCAQNLRSDHLIFRLICLYFWYFIDFLL